MFTDHVVIVTGASAGIGAAVARAFAAEGAHLVLVARTPGPLQILADELGGEAVAMDVSDIDACERLVADVISRHGRLDVLVNNAGMHLRGDFDAHDHRGFAKMVDVNLTAPLVLMRLCWPHLLAAERGVVVNVGSLAGLLPLPHAATYSATKNGLRALSRALAQEWEGRGIQICQVNPGPVKTGFILEDLDKVSEASLAQPMSSPEEIAALVLASAVDGTVERNHPARSARLATVAGLFPRVAAWLKPRIEAKGRRVRERLKAERSA